MIGGGKDWSLVDLVGLRRYCIGLVPEANPLRLAY